MIAKKKKKPLQSKKKVKLKAIPEYILDTIKCAVILERTIYQCVSDLRPLFPVHSTCTAGLALAISALTQPNHKTFARMIAEITPNVLKDYGNMKPFMDEIRPSRSTMH